MNRLLQKPRLLFGLFALLVVLLFGARWLSEGPSSKELFLLTSKVADFERGCLSVHGLVWWTPNYLQGQSWAGFWVGPLSYILFELGHFLFFPCGAVAAYKIVALLGLLVAGVAMYDFMLELSGSAWTAAAAGIFYLLCPEVSLRLGQAEHLSTGLCFIFPPLVCRALLRLRRGIEDPAFLAQPLELALSLGAFFLMATKMAILSLPLFCLYGFWLLKDLQTPSRQARFLRVASLGGLWGGLLGGLPLLPLMREEKWMTLFSTDPLQAWQISFTLKSGFSFWNRGGALIGHLGEGASLSGEAFYIGALWTVALGGALLQIGPWRGWLPTAQGRLCRLFLSLTLVFVWFSYGSSSPWFAHRHALAPTLPDWAPFFLWIGLAVQGAVVYRLASFWRRGRLTPLAATFLFLFGSGFAAINLLPAFSQIRAPAALWTLNGSFCLAAAGALALHGAVERLTARTAVRGGILALAAALLWIDFSPYRAEFSRQELAPGNYADYLQTAAFLRTQPWGYVDAVTSRYFFLTLPQLADKPLTCEAATSYLQPRWIRPYQNLTRLSPFAFTAFLPASGTSYVLIDRLDPSYNPRLTAFLRQNSPLLYENRGFSVFGCPGSIAPALATGRIVVPPAQATPGEILESVVRDVWPVEGPFNTGAPPGAHPQHSQVLLPTQPRGRNYHTIAFASTPPGQPWVIVPESYHPDWRATSDGHPVPVYRAVGCLLAARAAQDGAGVTFYFKQPWWYNGCLIAAALAWIASLTRWWWRRPR